MMSIVLRHITYATSLITYVLSFITYLMPPVTKRYDDLVLRTGLRCSCAAQALRSWSKSARRTARSEMGIPRRSRATVRAIAAPIDEHHGSGSADRSGYARP
jgi:hypothetical protein